MKAIGQILNSKVIYGDTLFAVPVLLLANKTVKIANKEIPADLLIKHTY